MTIHQKTAPVIAGRTVAAGLPLYRLNLMRVGYAVMGFGLVAVKWPLLVTHPDPWPLFDGVTTCLLVAMSVLALLGLRYPVRLLPILLAAPQLAVGTMDAATRRSFDNCLVGVIVFAVVPWRHVWQQFVTAKGDRWR